VGLGEFKALARECERRRRQRPVSALEEAAGFFRANVAPGIAFSFLRECGATGTGIVLGPRVRVLLAPWFGPRCPPLLAKVLSGVLAGMGCSLATQWLHNNALRAGNLAQTTVAVPSSAEVLRLTWAELGARMFFQGASRRVLSTATATAVLGVVDVFA